MVIRFLSLLGNIAIFGLRAIASAFAPPYEWQYLLMQIRDIGWQSVPLISAAGFALGVVMTLHTRSLLASFGADAWAPTLQSTTFFNELSPLVTSLLVAGRAGSGIGAELANMRVTEQIDAIEVMSLDSFKLLVVTRIVACTLVLPLLTVFMNLTSMLGGFLSEYLLNRMSFHLYLVNAFSSVGWANFIPPTFKTCVFGFIIGTVSCFYGYNITGGSDGVRRAATNSVVTSSLLIIMSDVVLVKLIFFLFPGDAI
jgi:phospholipid/cholesterol/gamma-HCH transport system permease protein